MMAAEYKKRGGGYNTTKEEGQTESQKHLDDWTKEEWQTKEGKGTAKQNDGSRKRYLPKKAWEELSESQKAETDEKKVKESKKGRQFVGNTDNAKDARRRASVGSGDGDEKKAADANDDDDDDTVKEKPTGTEVDDSENDNSNKAGAKAGAKRKAKQGTSPSKKQRDNVRMQSLRKRN
ncbi:uncharacterized protein N7529_001290 [Penicillium soppii]|jgi:hypothetical protein|uniref:uncharacterized protein n=1 Tax=Penicillium soppii TaxID=69789 RepID=UPI0025487376|nr:uncharacterized protein N7529_001290 [Penicillium soppii]KAJ5882618.1 hypothetical protein N7529_001290 [Penicillium soppii]